MRILVYPETLEDTIGRFDDQDIEICILIKTSKEDICKIVEAFNICKIARNPTMFLHNLIRKAIIAVPDSEKQISKFGADNIFMHIDKAYLLSLVEEEGISEEKALEYLRDDINKMIHTANIFMELLPKDIVLSNGASLMEPIAILANLADALMLLITGGTPLIDRFDTLQADEYEFQEDLEEIIHGLKTHEYLRSE